MTMAGEPAFTYERTGFRFTVYPNRIEVEDRAKETILLRNVTDVSVGGLLRQLRVTTNDRKQREFNLGPKAEEARQAIAAML
jgi:hypothetical protein